MGRVIEIHRYVLRSAAPLNATSVRLEFHGALIRVSMDGGGWGYGCVHPWPELGDAELEDQLLLLKSGRSSPIVNAALKCAAADGQARIEGRSLFDGLNVPRSHATLPMNELAFEQAVAAGFDRVKVKMGRDLEAELAFVRRMAERYPDLRWRMDFNGTCSGEELDDFVKSCGESLLKRVDFFEDARFVGEGCGVVQAVDREVESDLEQFDMAVLKPAVNEMEPLLQRAKSAGKRVVVTSYMDHPLGQSYAAWQAAVALRDYPELLDVCGLMTHGLFESDVFTESLGAVTPQFTPALGAGLGFDPFLESLSWKPFC